MVETVAGFDTFITCFPHIYVLGPIGTQYMSNFLGSDDKSVGVI